MIDAAKLNALLATQGRFQKWLADRLGMKKTTFTGKLHGFAGHSPFTPAQEIRIAELLGVTVSMLEAPQWNSQQEVTQP